VHHHVLQLDQPVQMTLHLGGAEPGDRPGLAGPEAEGLACDPPRPARRGDPLVEPGEEAPGLGRELVQRAGEDVRGQAIRGGDVGCGDLDVGERGGPAGHGLPLPLVLVEERDRVDQGEVLLVIPPGPGPAIQEAELGSEGVHHRDGRQQPLRVLMELDQPLALGAGQEAVQGPRRPLPLVDRPGLRAALVHREHQGAVGQLLVHLQRRRGQEQLHRTLHPVGMRHQLARLGILAGRGDGELALALQELQGIRGPFGPFLFHEAQDLVLEIGFPEVVECLAGERGVVDPVFGRHKREERVHERRLARRTDALDQHRERAGQLPGEGGQIAD
jgi:hypothetical protein